jgi:hypothetical protein
MSCNPQQIGLPSDVMLNNCMPVDKKITPPDSTKISVANFASAFKNKNVKNVSSWSSLAQASSGSIISSVKATMDNNFQALQRRRWLGNVHRLNGWKYAAFRKSSRRDRERKRGYVLRTRNGESGKIEGLQLGLQAVTASLDTRNKSLLEETPDAKKEFREEFELKTLDYQMDIQTAKTPVQTKLAEVEVQAEHGSCRTRGRDVGA